MPKDDKSFDEMWKYLQGHLGYSDKELEDFKNNPRNRKVLGKWNDLANKTIIFDVIESHGCNINHKVGDRFLFGATGYMLAHKCPKKICPYIMPAMVRMMSIIQERIYEGLDPLPLFSRGQCDDVGIECGGWGRVIIEPRIVDR